MARRSLHNLIPCALLVAGLLVSGVSVSSCNSPGEHAVPEFRPVELALRRVDPPSKILFVGNSLTYYNGGVDTHLLHLVRAGEPRADVVVDSVVYPNRTVAGHYADRTTRSRIRQFDWDVVVVQGASYEASAPDAIPGFYSGVGDIAALVDETDASVALFMTWAFRSRPEMTNQVASAYVTAGNQIAALVLPVGLAWRKATAAGLRRNLYADDRHPAPAGTYLAAVVIYSSLFGKSGVGNTYTAGLPAELAADLQQIAWDTVQEFYDHPRMPAVTAPRVLSEPQ